MQTKYYLTFEQVGIIRRIPLKEQDPDMQGILDAFIQAFRIVNQMEDNEAINNKTIMLQIVFTSEGSQSNCLFLYVEPQLY